MRVFPTRLFHFDGSDPYVERRTLSGGTSISGEEDVIEVDGGGRVTLTLSEPTLDDPEVALAWRGLAALLGQTGAIVVPLGDAKHQMFGDVTTPVGGLPFWQEEDFEYGQVDAKASASAALGATTISVDSTGLNGPIRFGVWFSVKTPVWGHRAYQVTGITGAQVSFLPPLREAIPADTPLEFRDPKCVMKVEGEMRSPVSMGFMEADQVRFVEYPGPIA